MSTMIFVNKSWTIQRTWQHRVQTTKKNTQTNTNIIVLNVKIGQLCVCGLFEWKQICAAFYCLFISTVAGTPNIRGEGLESH